MAYLLNQLGLESLCNFDWDNRIKEVFLKNYKEVVTGRIIIAEN